MQFKEKFFLVHNSLKLKLIAIDIVHCNIGLQIQLWVYIGSKSSCQQTIANIVIIFLASRILNSHTYTHVYTLVRGYCNVLSKYQRDLSV